MRADRICSGRGRRTYEHWDNTMTPLNYHSIRRRPATPSSIRFARQRFLSRRRFIRIACACSGIVVMTRPDNTVMTVLFPSTIPMA